MATTSIILSLDIVKVFFQMVSSLHDWWQGRVFPNKLFRGIHGSTGHLKQILCYIHAWNDSSHQNLKTLRDAENIKKVDGCSQNGMED
jgi:hypothetical protein